MPLEQVLTSWLLCVFINGVPVETLLRIWDSLLREGGKVLFRVGLALLKVHERELLACTEFEDGFLLLQQTIPRSVESLDCDSLMKAAFGKTGFLKKFKMEHLTELRRAHRAEVLAELDLPADHGTASGVRSFQQLTEQYLISIENLVDFADDNEQLAAAAHAPAAHVLTAPTPLLEATAEPVGELPSNRGYTTAAVLATEAVEGDERVADAAFLALVDEEDPDWYEDV